MIGSKKQALSYFMCKEMLYDYVTNNLGDRKSSFLASLSEHPELDSDIKKLKSAIEFTSELSCFSVQSRLIDEIKNPSGIRKFLDFLFNTPIWVKAVFVLVVLSLVGFFYMQTRPVDSLAKVVAKNTTYSGSFVQRQTLRYSLEPKTGDNLTGLVEQKLLSLNARPTPEAPLWKKEQNDVLFTFTIDRVDFSVFEEYIKQYGLLTNLDSIEPQYIDQAFYNIELLLKIR